MPVAEPLPPPLHAPREDPALSADPDPLEGLFRRLHCGDARAEAELLPLLYGELRDLARGHMQHQRPEHTLQPTALVHEAYLRLCRGASRPWADRRHFLRLASRVMRQVLVDHARAKAADKRRHGGERTELEALVDAYESRSGGLMELEEALRRLEARDPQAVRLIELRFFGGHSMEETAELLGISERQARRWWAAARLQLQAELENG